MHGCGLCEQLCPVGAVRVTYVAKTDPQKCTGCGICVRECPRGAIRLRSTGRGPNAERGEPDDA
ncbi:MAG: 4Fe-4S binding protein [Candidatus Brocadiia bacterium]